MKRSAAELQKIAAAAENLFPLHDNVLICRDDAEESLGGILLPDTAKEKPARGLVVKTGPGMVSKETGTLIRSEHWAKVGDNVYFSKYGGAEITHNGMAFLLVTQEHLMAKVE